MAATARSFDEIFALNLKHDEGHEAELLKEAKGVTAPRLLSASDLEAQEPPTWYMEQFLQEDSLTFMYGPPKIGKTFLALDWAYCLATARPWLDFRTVPIRVLYCSAEGNRTLGERIKALRKGKGYPVDPARLKFLPGVRQLFYRTPGKPKALLELVLAIQEFKPHLVILDTLARHTPGADVAANVDMSKVVFMLDELRETFGCSFLVIHHTRKDGGDYLGATHLFGAADAMIEVEQCGGAYGDDTPRAFRLHILSKDLEEFSPPYMFKIAGVGNEPGWGIVENMSAVAGGLKMNEVHEWLIENGPATVAQIAKGVWGTKATGGIHNVVARLAERGLVQESLSPGKTKRWEAVE